MATGDKQADWVSECGSDRILEAQADIVSAALKAMREIGVTVVKKWGPPCSVGSER